MTFGLENQGPVAAIAERSSKIKIAILIYLSRLDCWYPRAREVKHIDWNLPIGVSYNDSMYKK